MLEIIENERGPTLDYATIAIAISTISLVVSFGNLAWNVRSKYLAPKPKVGVRISQLHRGGVSGPNTGSAMKMIVVNHGPGRLVVSTVLQTTWVRYPEEGKGSFGHHLNLFSGRDNEPFEGISEEDLPLVLDFADQAIFYYADFALMQYPEHFPDVQVGVVDSWGRAHLPSQKDKISALENIHKIWMKRHGKQAISEPDPST